MARQSGLRVAILKCLHYVSDALTAMIGRCLSRLLPKYSPGSVRHAGLRKSYLFKRLAQVGADVVMVAAHIDKEAGNEVESAQPNNNYETRR
jgi:hypothetical protein